MTSEELAAEVAQVYVLMKQPIDRTPEGLCGEIDTRSQWLARSAELEADAQEILNQKRGEEAGRCHAQGIAPSIAKEIINGASRVEQRLYTLAERLNSTIVHQLDGIRSILSYEKESRRNT